MKEMLLEHQHTIESPEFGSEKVDSVRALVVLLPTADELRDGLKSGEIPELQWVLVKKDGKNGFSADRWGLPGGSMEEARSDRDGVVESAIGQVMGETNLSHFLPGKSELYRGAIKIPNGSAPKDKNVALVGLVSPGFDQPHLVASEEEGLSDLARVKSSDMIKILKGDGSEVMEGSKYMEYLNSLGVAGAGHVEKFENAYRGALERLLAKHDGNVEEVIKELVLAEAKEYLKGYKDDIFRFSLATIHIMFGNGVSLWDERDELLNVFGNEDDVSGIKEYFDLINLVGKTELEGSVLKGHLEDLSSEKYDFIERDETDFMNDFIGSVKIRVGKNLGADINIRNLATNASVDLLCEMMVNGTAYSKSIGMRERYEAARSMGIKWVMANLYDTYIEKRSYGNGSLDRYIHYNFDRLVDENGAERVFDFGVTRGKAVLRKYTTQSGREVVVAVDEAPAKSFTSFVRKVLTEGVNKIDEIQDIFRMSIVLVGELVEEEIVDDMSDVDRRMLAEEFANSLIVALGREGMYFGSKNKEVGKVKTQFEVMGGGRGQKVERSGSIADRFAMTKGYVFDGNGLMSELAIWALPYANSKAIAGEIDFDAKYFGYAEKLLDDEAYKFWRLAWVFPVFFSNLIYQASISQDPFVRNKECLR